MHEYNPTPSLTLAFSFQFTILTELRPKEVGGCSECYFAFLYLRGKLKYIVGKLIHKLINPIISPLQCNSNISPIPTCSIKSTLYRSTGYNTFCWKTFAVNPGKKKIVADHDNETLLYTVSLLHAINLVL